MISNPDSPVLEDEPHPDVFEEYPLMSTYTDEDMLFAKQRYKLHQASAREAIEVDTLQKYFHKKYGF